ncbi:hypothetical protein RHMOL_Rhmol07G0278200 [Rhododendron molle]|uniref:Uncharacterized protein n=1 Tax=Rhododendron molle TaxID=49168 RepID=A0ACC0N779_RHOML|nr:hypothetical protein RHMOL_Rhmol07G0278200 [Rhododendron molle]
MKEKSLLDRNKFAYPCQLLSYDFKLGLIMETGHELGNRYSEVIALQDMATYGGLCGLASFDRTELKASMPCLLLLNSSYVILVEGTRLKAHIQYTHPFMSVDLGMTATAFKTSTAGLEKELEALITDNGCDFSENCLDILPHASSDNNSGSAPET